MIVLLFIFLAINLLAAGYLYRQGFVVRSNMRRKNKRRFFAMLAVMAGAAVLARTNLLWACVIAGIPAGLIALFAIGLGIAMSLHKGPWN